MLFSVCSNTDKQCVHLPGTTGNPVWPMTTITLRIPVDGVDEAIREPGLVGGRARPSHISHTPSNFFNPALAAWTKVWFH